MNRNPSILNTRNEITIPNCFPRPISGSHYKPKLKLGKVSWSIPISLFKDYIPDTDVLTI